MTWTDQPCKPPDSDTSGPSGTALRGPTGPCTAFCDLIRENSEEPTVLILRARDFPTDKAQSATCH